MRYLGVMNVYEIRRARLAQLITKRFDGSQADFARASGISPTYVTRMLKDDASPSRKRIGEDLARQIEDRLNLPSHWLDVAPERQNSEHHVSEPHTAYRGGAIADPLERSAQGAPVTAVARVGESGFFEQQPFDRNTSDGRVMTWVDKTAYALRIKGDDLAPAIENGQYLIVLPGAEPHPGERIVVSFKDGRKAILKLLFRRADTIAVTQLAGGVQQTLERDELEYVHAVFGLVEASQWWRAAP